MISYLGEMEFRRIPSGINRCVLKAADLRLGLTEEQPKSVSKLTLHVSSKTNPLFVQHINWQKFDEQASRLRNLHIARFYFFGPQNLAVVRSLADIIPCLSRLRDATKLRATYEFPIRCIHVLDINNLEGSLAVLGGIKEEEPSTSESVLEVESAPQAAADAAELQTDITRVGKEA